MSGGRYISDAAVAAGADPLSPYWVRSELRCTKAGLRGRPKVLDLTRVVHHDGANLSKVGLSECAARVAPLVAARGDADTPVFEAMEEPSAASAAAVGTAAFNNAEEVRAEGVRVLKKKRTRTLSVFLYAAVPTAAAEATDASSIASNTDVSASPRAATRGATRAAHSDKPTLERLAPSWWTTRVRSRTLGRPRRPALVQ